MTAHKTPSTPAGSGKEPRRRGAQPPHATRVFWALWLVLFAAYVLWQLSRH